MSEQKTKVKKIVVLQEADKNRIFETLDEINVRLELITNMLTRGRSDNGNRTVSNGVETSSW